MRANMILPVLCFLVFEARAQSTTKSVSNFQGNTIAYGFVTGGMLQFGNDNSQALNKHLTRHPRSGFTMGGVVSFRRNAWNLETGFEFNKEGYKYDVTPDPQFPLAPHVLSEKHNISFHSLAIPLRAVYPFSQYRLRTMVALGIVPQFLIKEIHHEVVNYDEGSSVSNVYREKYRYSTFYPAVTVGYAIEYDIDQDVALRVEPQIKFSLLQGKDSNYTTSMSAFSLRVSLLLFN